MYKVDFQNFIYYGTVLENWYLVYPNPRRHEIVTSFSPIYAGTRPGIKPLDIRFIGDSVSGRFSAPDILQRDGQYPVVWINSGAIYSVNMQKNYLQF